MGEQVLLSLAIYGLAIVISFVVAVMIKGIVVALPMMGRVSAKPEPTPNTRSVETAPPGIPPEHVAAIAGAVAAMVKVRHILHIEDHHSGRDWMTEGRMIHQTSHYVPRRGRR